MLFSFTHHVHYVSNKQLWHSRQHKFLEVIDCLLANHDDSKLYAQLHETTSGITLLHTVHITTLLHVPA